MNLVLAINPHSGAGSGRRAAPEVLAALQDAGHSVKLVEAGGVAEQQVQLAAALAEAVDALVVVGGDGMVHIGVNAVAGTQTPLGIVPVGTGNDVARSLGLPIARPAAAVAALLAALEGKPRTIDLGCVSSVGRPDVWFAAACSAGLDAVVNARANSWNWPRGRAKYILALLRVLPGFRPRKYRLQVDGRQMDTKAMLVCVSNMRSIGGGMVITPDARLDDGRLDLLIVDPMPMLKMLALFPLIFSGRHVGLRSVHLGTVSTVELEVPGIVLFADGEPVGSGRVRIAVVPAALRVLSEA